jgi:hypothetical protein
MPARLAILLTALCVVGLVAEPVSAQGGGSSSTDAAKARRYAKIVMDRYDKNGDNMLDKDERATLRGITAGADLNGDDVITADEIVRHSLSGAHAPARPQEPEPTKPEPAKLETATAEPAATTVSADQSVSTQAKTQQQPAPRRREQRESRESRASTSGRQPESPSSEKRVLTATGQRKSYRFKSPVERLPAGLPSWFNARDADHDGQVAMSEYSRTWTDRTAEEFCGLDRNNDGFITAAECLRDK